MKADLTRTTFDPSKHFARVLMQQGRVQLDADWNEQAAILLDNFRILAADWIGEHGGPQSNLGFEISGLSDGPLDFAIGSGHYYVAGVLCEADRVWIPVVTVGNTASNQVQVAADRTKVVLRPNQYLSYTPSSGASVVARISRAEANNTLTLSRDLGAPAGSNLQLLSTYLTQPDYPVPASERLVAGKSYQIYLDVWERLVTYVEDDSIREVALGGPDTAARSKVVWQVKQTTPCQSGATNVCCTVPALTQRFQPDNRGVLKAIAKQKGSSTDPCVISPDASYRGPENQLYRVEIHTGALDRSGNPAIPTFKWSRENGSVVFPIVSLSGGGGTVSVTLENLGRDDRFGLNEGDWVEIQDDDYVLQNRAEPLLEVKSIDNTTLSVTLAGNISDAGQNPDKHPLLRRWDQKSGDPAEGGLQLGQDNAALIVEGSGDNHWLAIENGIEVQFQTPPPTGNMYRTGDYWLIPARTATGDVEWPTRTKTDASGNTVSTPLALPPDGITHYYAPLALITVDAAGPVNPDTDCRRQFPAQAQPIPPRGRSVARPSKRIQPTAGGL